MSTVSKTDGRGGTPACVHESESLRQTLLGEAMAIALGQPRQTGDLGGTRHTALRDLEVLTIAAYAATLDAAPVYPQINLSFLCADTALLPICSLAGACGRCCTRARGVTE